MEGRIKVNPQIIPFGGIIPFIGVVGYMSEAKRSGPSREKNFEHIEKNLRLLCLFLLVFIAVSLNLSVNF